MGSLIKKELIAQTMFASCEIFCRQGLKPSKAATCSNECTKLFSICVRSNDERRPEFCFHETVKAISQLQKGAKITAITSCDECPFCHPRHAN